MRRVETLEKLRVLFDAVFSQLLFEASHVAHVGAKLAAGRAQFQIVQARVLFQRNKGVHQQAQTKGLRHLRQVAQYWGIERE